MKESQRRKKRLERELIQPITASQAKKIEDKLDEIRSELEQLKGGGQPAKIKRNEKENRKMDREICEGIRRNAQPG